MLECPVCGQTVPSDKGRVTFHLTRGIFTDEYRVCPGSQNGAPKNQKKKKPYYTMVPILRVCAACQRGDHLLCDDCQCARCSHLDLPH
jgi:hypothetical protein